MDGYHFFTSSGCFNWKQTEECGRFEAETKGLVIQQMWTRFVKEKSCRRRDSQSIDSAYSSEFFPRR